MAKQKIADFAADLEVRVKNLKGLSDFQKKFDELPKKFKKTATAIEQSQRSLTESIRQGAKEMTKIANKQRQELEKTARLEQKRLRASKWARATAKNTRAWQQEFKGSVGRLTGGSRNVTNKARSAQQAMYDNLFGARQSAYAGMDKAHAAAIRMDAARTKAAQNIARIQENVARREQEMARRTAAIREAGAAKAAALIRKAEIQAQMAASRMGGGGSVGRPHNGRGLLGGATVGGALGAATSNMSGLLPGFGAAYAAVNFNRIGQDLVAAENSIRALAPNSGEANQILGFLNKFGGEVGGSLSDMTRQFASVYASTRANIGAESTQDIFRGIIKYSNVLGMDDEAVKGTLRAVSQMFSKDRIMAEEARSQLAERMPAAMQMLASVVAGGDTAKLDKMMTSGELDPKQVMPLFAKLAEETADANGAYEKSLETARTAQRRLRFEFEQFIKVFYAAGGEAGFSKIFNSMAGFFRENEDLATGLGVAWDKFGKIVERTVDGVDNLLDGFSMLSQKIGLSESEMAMLSATALVLATRFGKISAIFGALFLLLEDISVGMKGGDSYTKDFLDFLDANAWAEVTIKTAAFAASLMLVAGAIGKIGLGLGAIGGGAAAGGGGVVGTILSIITKHPLMAALVAATIALNTAQSVYSERADKHLEGVIARSNPSTAEDLKRLSSGGVELKDIARPNPDFYRDFPSGALPGINQPLMMVDKVAISVSGTGDPEETAKLVVVKLREFAKQATTNLTVPQ